jgi:hypothetical protein
MFALLFPMKFGCQHIFKSKFEIQKLSSKPKSSLKMCLTNPEITKLGVYITYVRSLRVPIITVDVHSPRRGAWGSSDCQNPLGGVGVKAFWTKLPWCCVSSTSPPPPCAYMIVTCFYFLHLTL